MVILVDSREKKNAHILDYFRKGDIKIASGEGAPDWEQGACDYRQF